MASVNSPDYLSDLHELYGEYLAAEKLILKTGQEYTIGDRTLRRADLGKIRKERALIANQIAKLEAGKGIRTQRVVMINDT